MTTPENIVQLTVTKESTVVSEASFGIPCIFSNGTPLDVTFTSGSRTYSSLTALSADFGISTDTYLAAAALMGQDVKPVSFRVFLRGAEVAPIKTATLTGALSAGHKINAVINGVALTETEFADTSPATVAALAAKIAAIPGVASAVKEIGDLIITVTATAGYTLSMTFTTSGTAAPTIAVATSNAGYTIADDIAAAIADKTDWYTAHLTVADSHVIKIASETINSYKRMGFFRSLESGIFTTSTTDIASVLQDSASSRTVLFATKDVTDFQDCAWAGRCLPIDPGQGRWGLRKLSGVTVDSLTDSEISNLLGKNANCYTEIGGVNLINKNAKAMSGDAVETTRNIDYLESRIVTEVFTHIVDKEIIYFTDADAQTVVDKLKYALSYCAKKGIIKEDFVVTAPKVIDVSATDRRNKLFPDISFTANGKGSIENVVIAGTVII